MYLNTLSNIGLAYIMQKKSFLKDDKPITYFEIIDCVYGFKYDYKNVGFLFTSLSKNLGTQLPTAYNSKNEYFAINFQSIEELSSKNNNVADIDKFLSEYKKNIGKFCFYIPDQNTFESISDQELIQQIEKSKSKEDFNGNLLNKNSEISKMYSEIKKTIISQDKQIMQILTTLFKNQKVVNGSFDIDMISKLKENLIIYGPTGTGKTEILKRIAKIYKVPIVIEDATSLTESGFVGRDIQDMLNDLYLAANRNIEVAQKGILVIDEFDKLAEKDSTHNHVSKEGVQRSLLKLLDGSEYYFNGLTFNTSKLSVVALGAFTGITNSDDYTGINIKDFVDYGIMRELMGRFSKLVAMNYLTKEDIKKILIESSFSPINTYKVLFDSMNIVFTYDDDFIDYIAAKAIALNSGARSLKTVFDDIISSAMFKIFDGDYSSIHLINPNESESPYVLTKKKMDI